MGKTEAQTRAELIDQQLGKSGWNAKDPSQVIEEFDILTSPAEKVAEPRRPYEGHQFSDYVLLGKNGKPLAVVEAKKTSKDAAIGREQANNTASIFRNNSVENYRFAFTPMATKPIFGISTITHLAKSWAFPLAMTLNDSNIFAATANP